MGAMACAAAFAVVLLTLLRPRLRSALRAVVAWAALILLFEFSFFLWVQNAVAFGVAKLAAVTLLALGAATLATYLRLAEARD